MITPENIHAAWRESGFPRDGFPWGLLEACGQQCYRRMATRLEVRSGICPACSSIPAEGLQDVDGQLRCGHDCPGVDSGKYCDHRSVGAIIRNEKGNILLFARNTFPFAIAGPAGHCDGDEEEDAVRAEVEQETGLLVLDAKVLARFWHHSRCRRRYAGRHGHMWTMFSIVATGQIHSSEREVQHDTLRWYSPEEIAELVERTTRKLVGEGPTGDTLDIPWYWFFVKEMGYKA